VRLHDVFSRKRREERRENQPLLNESSCFDDPLIKHERSHIESRYVPKMVHVSTTIDEGMTNGPPIFAYLVFGPERVSLERLSRPIKVTV
jgi:hypothetical protein